MRQVAFKRVKNTPIRGNMHEEYIVEFAYIDLFDKGYHKEDEGYEFLPEDKFDIEFAKNPGLLEEYEKKQQRLMEQNRQEKLQKQVAVKQKEKEDFSEFEEFKRWKEQQGKS